MKKRSYALFLALLMLLSMSLGVSAMAAESEESGVYVTGGTDGRVAVYLVDGEGATNGRLTVRYDSAYATLRQAVAAGDWVTSVNSEEAGRVSLAWVGSDLGEGNNLMLTLYFDLKPSSTVTFSAEVEELYCSGTALELANMEGEVTLTGAAATLPPSGTINTPTPPDKPDQPSSEDPTDTPIVYIDVEEEHWAYEAIYKATEAGIFNGTSANTFSPSNTVDRAQFATIIYRIAGSPEVSGTSPFTDVEEGSYYADAVKWAADNGLVKGVTADSFAPHKNISRQEMFALLHRYAQFAEMEDKGAADLTVFSDADTVGDWALESMAWAVGNGYVQGSNGALHPLDGSIRAEAAMLMCRFLGL